ncbi:MAG: hypothetical protein P4L27_01750 [Ignavibacteriaceae bacterium]|nr:hypothetical protein [Ignavibacteriaceae bacterium]
MNPNLIDIKQYALPAKQPNIMHIYPNLFRKEDLRFDIFNYPFLFNDPEIVKLIPEGKTIGCFYIESPGTQTFNLEIKGSKFTSNSVVLWNGNERATTFVSDSILHATINVSDISSRGNSLVTVKTGYDISDTLMFTVVDSLTMPVHPILECVHKNGNNTYTAHFGYQNDLDKTVLVPVGGQNSFSPGQTDRGQTTIFYPGRHTDVFTVEFNGSNIS